MGEREGKKERESLVGQADIRIPEILLIQKGTQVHRERMNSKVQFIWVG